RRRCATPARRPPRPTSRRPPPDRTAEPRASTAGVGENCPQRSVRTHARGRTLRRRAFCLQRKRATGRRSGDTLARMITTRTPTTSERLFEQRILVLGDAVDDEQANRLVAQLLLLSADDPHSDICLHINSP